MDSGHGELLYSKLQKAVYPLEKSAWSPGNCPKFRDRILSSSGKLSAIPGRRTRSSSVCASGRIVAPLKVMMIASHVWRRRRIAITGKSSSHFVVRSLGLHVPPRGEASSGWCKPSRQRCTTSNGDPIGYMSDKTWRKLAYSRHSASPAKRTVSRPSCSFSLTGHPKTGHWAGELTAHCGSAAKTTISSVQFLFNSRRTSPCILQASSSISYSSS